MVIIKIRNINTDSSDGHYSVFQGSVYTFWSGRKFFMIFITRGKNKNPE